MKAELSTKCPTCSSKIILEEKDFNSSKLTVQQSLMAMVVNVICPVCDSKVHVYTDRKKDG